MTKRFLDRVPPREGDGEGSADAFPGAWVSSYPCLVEFLAARRWSDGDVRIPGTLSLFTDEGMWKICLSDKAQGRIAFVSGATPPDALLAAERGLLEDRLDWRAQRQYKGGRRS